MAKALVAGEINSVLPCLYVSRNNDDTLPIDAKILAKALSGLSHVVVEPSRSFSFNLMETAFRKNPYGGAVGLFAKTAGELKRFFPTENTEKYKKDFLKLIEEFVVDTVSKRTAQHGWEWQSLQEHQARHLRAKLTEQTSDDLTQYMEQFDSEIDALKEKTQILKNY